MQLYVDFCFNSALHLEQYCALQSLNLYWEDRFKCSISILYSELILLISIKHNVQLLMWSIRPIDNIKSGNIDLRHHMF